jgi:hypothetical protein
MIEIRPGVFVDSIPKDWQLRMDFGSMPLPNAIIINGQRYEKKK